MFKPKRSPAKAQVGLCISVLEKDVKQLSHIAIVSLKGHLCLVPFL